MSLASAIATGDVAELPSRRDEDWRWTDLRGLIRVLPPASPASDRQFAPGPFADLGEDEVVFVNGVCRGGEGRLILKAGEQRTVRLRVIADADHASHRTGVVVWLGQGATLTLLESYEGMAAGYVADTELTITLEAQASLQRIVLATDEAEAVSVSTAVVALAPGAKLAQTTLTDGARRQRLETRVTHPGHGADVRIDAAYLLNAQRHADLTTVVTHTGVEGTTSQLTKGLVRDQARAVFQGRIVVCPGADQTDARMAHNALILSEKAEVDAKPELLIYADEVSCAHGNTIGALDEDALFYATQRGIPDAQARAMLAAAFVGEVIDRIEQEGAQAVARAWAARRLEQA